MKKHRPSSGSQSRKYTAVYERDEGAWTVRIAEVQGCHTYGRSIAQARERIREALGLFDDDAERAVIVDDVRIPAKAKRAIASYRKARAKAELAQRLASERSRELVQRLVREGGLSTRDAAEVTGLSPQRISQLAAETADA